MTSYALLADAENDLLEIMIHLNEKASEEVAGRFPRSLFHQARTLAEFPGMGVGCRLRSPSLKTVRRFPVKHFRSWLIFYRPVEPGIEVLRILHASRNWRELFL